MTSTKICLIESQLLVEEPGIIEAFNYVIITSSCVIVLHTVVIQEPKFINNFLNFPC